MGERLDEDVPDTFPLIILCLFDPKSFLLATLCLLSMLFITVFLISLSGTLLHVYLVSAYFFALRVFIGSLDWPNLL